MFVITNEGKSPVAFNLLSGIAYGIVGSGGRNHIGASKHIDIGDCPLDPVVRLAPGESWEGAAVVDFFPRPAGERVEIEASASVLAVDPKGGCPVGPPVTLDVRISATVPQYESRESMPGTEPLRSDH